MALSMATRWPGTGRPSTCDGVGSSKRSRTVSGVTHSRACSGQKSDWFGTRAVLGPVDHGSTAVPSRSVAAAAAAPQTDVARAMRLRMSVLACLQNRNFPSERQAVSYTHLTLPTICSV
eukprot:2923238-Prymnesium_polylepis.1